MVTCIAAPLLLLLEVRVLRINRQPGALSPVGPHSAVPTLKSRVDETATPFCKVSFIDIPIDR